MRVEAQKIIAAPVPEVWQLLDRPNSWRVWWQDCVEAHTLDYKGLRETSVLELVLQPGQLRLTYFPWVDALSPNKTLILRYSTLWVRFNATFQLQEHTESGGTNARLILDYGGPQMMVARLTGQGHQVTIVVDRCLRGLKRAAEHMV